MLEELAPFVSGAAGVGAGSLTMWLVMRERLSNLIATQQDRDLRYTARLDRHAREIDDLKERKHCGPCHDLTVERRKHDEMQQRQLREEMAGLKGEMVKTREAFNSCFDDLLKVVTNR